SHGVLVRTDTWRDPTGSLMSDGASFIDQCTYWHLTKVLSQPALPDPVVLQVQGRLAQDDTRVIGKLGPAYELDSTPELTAGSGGDYAIVVRDVFGNELARYPFVAHWSLMNDADGSTVP